MPARRLTIAFVVHPCPALLDDAGRPYGPVRTNFFPQSQITLCSVLRQHGFDATLLDLRSLDEPLSWMSQRGEPYADPIDYGGVHLHRYLLGDYRRRIQESPKDTDVYALTSNFTYEANAVRETIQALRAHNPRAVIIVGGRDASPAERRAFYFESGADYIGEGDADASLVRFLASLPERLETPTSSRRLPLLHPQQDDRVIAAAPVDEMPFIDLDAVFVDFPRVRTRLNESGGGSILESVAAKGFATYVETSRGCPRECNFCTEARTKTIRLDVPTLKKQVDHFLDRGAALLMFSDDNLLTRKASELIELFQFLRERKTAWEFPVGLEIGLLSDSKGTIKRDLLDALFWNNGDRADYAGAHRMLFPVEDSLLRETNLSKLRKKVEVQILEAILDSGLPFLNLAIMVGAPQETPEERQRLEAKLFDFVRLAEGTGTRINFSIFCTMPLPGTEFATMMTEQSRVAYDIDRFPELWNVFCSVLQGETYSAESITAYRRHLLAQHAMQQDFGKIQLTGDR